MGQVPVGIQDADDIAISHIQSSICYSEGFNQKAYSLFGQSFFLRHSE